jgi:hypothetical protein
MSRFALPSRAALLTAAALTASVLAAPSALAVTAPSVSKVAPNTGKTAGGTAVTITGAGFSGATKVLFGTTAGKNFQAVSGTKVTVTSPAHTASTVDVHVVTGHGTSATRAADHFTFMAPPAISWVRTSDSYPGSGTEPVGPDTGGTNVTLGGAHFSRVQRVTFDGVAGTDLVVSGTTSLSVTTPQHAPGAVDVTVVGSYGSATKTNGFTYHLGFHAPETIDPAIGDPTILSCPSAADAPCHALDPWGNVTTGVANGTWTKQSVPTEGRLYDLSCYDQAVCAAVDSLDFAFVSTDGGATWQKSRDLSQYFSTPMTHVSCSSASFCLAVDNVSDYTIWNGTSWSPLKLPDGTTITDQTQYPSGHSAPLELSCGGTQCVLIDDRGKAFRYRNGAWDAGTTVDGNNYPQALSCANTATSGTTLLCALGDNIGNLYSLVGGTWYRSGNHDGISGVSCTAAKVCVATGWMNAYVLNPAAGPPAWSRVALPNGATFGSGVSCNTQSCTAFTSSNASARLTLSTRRWTAPTAMLAPHEGLTAFACSGGAAPVCLAGDRGPFAITRSGDAWSDPQQVLQPGEQIDAVSCAPASAFCLAGTNTGSYLTYDGTTLSAPATTGASWLNSVSCTSASSCAAGDDSGNLYSWDGSSWSGPFAVGSTSQNPIYLSCPAASTTCTALDINGLAWSFDTTTDAVTPISTAVPIDTTNGDTVAALSCTSGTFCMVASTLGQSYRFDPSTGTAARYPVISMGNFLSAISCTGARFCVAVGTDGGYVWGGSSWYAVPASDFWSITSVDCTAPGSCLTGDGAGRIVPLS